MTASYGAGAESTIRALPELLHCVDAHRIASEPTVGGDHGVDDFGLASSGGRGESYVVAQQSTSVRIHGIAQLLDFLGKRESRSKLVVDLLGGEGLIYRAAKDLGAEHRIVTCDASPYMVAEARRQGIPALVQRAQDLIFRDATVGGVLLAYGSHHIPPHERGGVVSEAARVLEPGGVFVLHDFLVGSPTDEWFGEVVHEFARTGHDFDHFADGEVDALLRAQFEIRRVVEIDDPFETTGSTRDEATARLGRYLVDMYGLTKLKDKYGVEGAGQRALDAAESIFGVDVIGDRASGRWTATMARRAVVGIGKKQLDGGEPRLCAGAPAEAHGCPG